MTDFNIVLILTILSTSLTIIFSIIQIYLKIKQSLKNAIEEIVQKELTNLRMQLQDTNKRIDNIEEKIKELNSKIK
ncbi:hypothetical protein N617_gp20 [Stygiolobus rod-shaped virus]|uniref:Uncharacterized protein n=1 Tax=Stygiolobus rod-shaped virus TaxID=537009 RepID=B6EFC6_9VIRU|nr:hypothetical protein N617_gp20 [Stygiolobus rod-shaped virus]CAQ58461.1 hypothetical protein [Stygiolobus rod-shaped virus]